MSAITSTTILGQWPSYFNDKASSMGFLERFKQNVSAGINYVSEFAGYSSHVEGMRIQVKETFGEAAPAVKTVRYCEKNLQAQSVAQFMTSMRGEDACIHTDIDDSLSESAKAFIDAIAPERGSDDIESALKANADVRTFLCNNDWALPRNMGAYCLQHHQICPVYPGHAMKVIASGGDLRIAISTHERDDRHCRQIPQWLQDESADLEQAQERPSKLRRPDSFTFHDESSARENACSRRKMLITVGCPPCIDFSRLAKKALRREAGESERFHWNFIAQRKVAAKCGEDVFFMEFTPLKRDVWKARYRVTLQETHHFVGLCISTHKGGFPLRRERFHGAGINLAEQVWTGPESDDNVEAAFIEFFGRACGITGAVYLQAGEDDVLEFCGILAESQHKSLPQDFTIADLQSNLALMYPVGVMETYREHLVEYANHEHISEDAPYFAHLDHHPGAGATAGHLMPTADTHPNFWEFTRDRMVLPREVLASMGVDSYLALSGGRPLSDIATCLDQMPHRPAGKMIGNAVHVPVAAAWQMFVLGHIRSREDGYRLSRDLLTIVIDEEIEQESHDLDLLVVGVEEEEEKVPESLDLPVVAAENVEDAQVVEESQAQD